MEHKTLFDTIKVKEEEDGESRYVTCEECDTHIDCYNDTINIVYKGGDSVNIPYEELVLCTMCFHDMKHELIQQDYKCDDWDIDEEEYLKELEIERISNGECPKISHDLYLSRLTSEQREVEKENDILWGIRLKEMNIQHEKQSKQDEEDELRALKNEKMQEALAVLISYEDHKKEKESGEEVEEEEEVDEEEVEEASLSYDEQQGKHSNTDLVQLCVNMD